MIIKIRKKKIKYSIKKMIKIIKVIKKNKFENIKGILETNKSKGFLIIKNIYLEIFKNILTGKLKNHKIHKYEIFTNKSIQNKKIIFRAKGKTNIIKKKRINITFILNLKNGKKNRC
ncbi:MAG: uL22 family ribosomal protein [Candidatus Vidania fulgoroideorum]